MKSSKKVLLDEYELCGVLKGIRLFNFPELRVTRTSAFKFPRPSPECGERLWSFWLDEEIWLELESFDVISVITSPVFSSGIVPSLIGQLFKSNQFYRSTTECIRDVKIEICYNRRTELNKLSTFTTNAQLNSEWIALGADYPFCRLLLLSKYITISPL